MKSKLRASNSYDSMCVFKIRNYQNKFSNGIKNYFLI